MPGSARSFPTNADLMVATDDASIPRSFLATEENFAVIKDLHGRNLIVPVVGNSAGPKAMLEQNVQPEMLQEVGELDYPVFYMNYALNPQASPWRDAISHAVRFFKGYEFTISRPRDLWFAPTWSPA